jgi:hypothetical protein
MQSKRSILLIFTMVIFVACISKREQADVNKALSEVFFTPFNDLAVQITGGTDLAYATAAFQRKNGRWPTNQTELTNFVAKSDGYLVIREYDSIDFANQTNGAVRIGFVPHGRTNEQHLTVRTNLQAYWAGSSNLASTTSKPEMMTFLGLLSRTPNANNIVPKRFSVFVGSFPCSQYSVELRDGLLYYSATNSHCKKEFVKIKPTQKDWQRFRQTIDRIGIWRWQTNYNGDGYDGMQWRVQIQYQDRSISAEGSNSFPGASGKPDNNPENQVFNDYCTAVSALVWGRTFE